MVIPSLHGRVNAAAFVAVKAGEPARRRFASVVEKRWLSKGHPSSPDGYARGDELALLRSLV
jgi:hypothetical protein